VSYAIVDIETDGIGGAINRIGLATESGAWTLPWNSRAKQFAAHVLGDPHTVKVGHNAGQFDFPMLEDEGIEVAGERFDTMMAGQLIEPDLPLALRSMAPLLLDCHPFKHKAHTDPVFYNAADVVHTRELYFKQVDILKAEGMYDYFRTVRMPIIPVLVAQTKRGMKIDEERRHKIRTTLHRYLEDAYARWAAFTDINPRSNKDLCQHFYGRLSMKVQKHKDSKQPTVDIEALMVLRALYAEHLPMIDALIDIRRSEKVLSTYIDGLQTDRDGLIHPRYLPRAKDEPGEEPNKLSASTGRLAASPNSMNIPGTWKHQGRRIGKEEATQLLAEGAVVLPPIRDIFVPRAPGLVFIEGDWSQAELRAIAYMSGDKSMQLALQHDIHAEVQRFIQEETGLPIDRTLVKNAEFGTWYGATPRGLVLYMKARGSSITTKIAEKMQRGIARQAPVAWRWRNAIEAQFHKAGHEPLSLTNPFGHRRFFYGGAADAGEGMDFMPQSTVASMLCSVLPDLEHCPGIFTTTVHDSFLFEVEEGETYGPMQCVLEREFPQVAKGFYCPTEWKVGKESWGDLEPLKVMEGA
jgi:DNA polymerase I-like protein with 3'-5' exonuclease and polymerase domains